MNAPVSLASIASAYKQAKSEQRYDGDLPDAEIDRRDELASNAEDALIVELMSMGLSKDDARAMCWGLA